jgi:replication factor A1
MFLITKEKQIVSQLPISLNVLTDVRIRNIINRISLPQPRTSKIKRSRECRGVKVNQLRIGMRGVAIRVKVIDVSPPKEVATKWGDIARVSNVKVADETGMIRLVLWNDQVGIVHVGDVVTIKNFHVAEYAGALQLKLRRRGKISSIKKKWRYSHG